MRNALICLAALTAFGCSQQKQASPTAPLAKGGQNPTTEDQKTLYGLGLSMGRSIAVFDLTPDELAYVKAGLEAEVTHQTPAVKLEEVGPKISALARSRSTARAAKEKEKSKGFLEKAAQEEGAQKLASGLVFIPIKEGSGATPAATDTVKVNYRGTLTDGTEFDSSYKRNAPATFRLNQVIPCWTEGLQKMKVGGKAKLVCPSEIAYGDRGSPPTIPGGATLQFEVELLEAQASPPVPQIPGMHLPQMQQMQQLPPPKTQPSSKKQ